MHANDAMNDMPTTHAARRRRSRAFSLLELVLVIAIIGILMGIVTVNLVGGAASARKTSTIASMRTIKTGIEQYIATNGVPPTGLNQLVEASLISSDIADAWKRPFYYAPRLPGQKPAFDLISMGEDGVPQTADDLIIWDHLAE
jgi:prepilin-type N-terminal cleavage/methylation domain-containing protein